MSSKTPSPAESLEPFSTLMMAETPVMSRIAGPLTPVTTLLSNVSTEISGRDPSRNICTPALSPVMLLPVACAEPEKKRMPTLFVAVPTTWESINVNKLPAVACAPTADPLIWLLETVALEPAPPVPCANNSPVPEVLETRALAMLAWLSSKEIPLFAATTVPLRILSTELLARIANVCAPSTVNTD
ncbi:hypothetical protein [Pseudomonas sp.]|uniref:hypothetical protein n=1 Tax=Pseudomonas sp. TaxID=306 RepID=UPI003D6ED21A